jgi:hypothetical protein
MTMEYNVAVLVTMMHCLRCAVSRCALQSINGFLISSNGKAGKGPILIFFDSFNVIQQITVYAVSNSVVYAFERFL